MCTLVNMNKAHTKIKTCALVNMNKTHTQKQTYVFCFNICFERT